MPAKSRSYFYLIVIIATFLGCAPKQSVFLNQEVEKNTSASSFSVVPFNQKWTPEATAKTMYSQEIDYFFQALTPSFSSNTPNKVNVIQSDLDLTENSFEKRTLRNENQNLDINIPADTLMKQSSDRYIYFLEGYKFQLVKKAGDRVSYAYQQSEPELALQFETEFFLFDKNKSEVIAWGKVSDESLVFGRPKFADYLAVLTKVSRQMIEESPFMIY